MRLKLRCQAFFKTVIYMPNLIMASAFSMLFFTLFSDNGPVNAALMSMGVTPGAVPLPLLGRGNAGAGGADELSDVVWQHHILLMSGIMGIDVSLFEAAEIDGCTSRQTFWRVTLPLLKPILVYVLVTSLIGGLADV